MFYFGNPDNLNAKMTSLRDAAARRRMQLNPITTSLNVVQPQSHLQTPLSALSSSSLSAPFGYNPSYTPISAVRQQYNPQAWTSSPSVGSEGGTQFSARSPDPEGKIILLLVITFCLVLFVYILLGLQTNSTSVPNCSTSASIFPTTK